jgi:hypothetical protein
LSLGGLREVRLGVGDWPRGVGNWLRGEARGVGLGLGGGGIEPRGIEGGLRGGGRLHTAVICQCNTG